MPELPEVETTRSGIEPHLVNQTISDVTVNQPRLRIRVPNELKATLLQQTIQSVRRRSKYLLIELANHTLIIHLGMSGHLRVEPQKAITRKHDHIILSLGSGNCLIYNDPRRFGLFTLTERHLAEQHPLLNKLGPEPLSDRFNANYLRKITLGKQQAIKALLMDSQRVVGIGNIYATEILYETGIHPQQPAGSLSQQQLMQIVDETKIILQQAITAGGTTLKDFYQSNGKPGYFAQKLKAYGRAGEPCERCGQTLQAIQITQRKSVFCPNCQKP